MFKSFLIWKYAGIGLLAIFVLSFVQFVSAKTEYCAVINDFREVDAVKISQAFNNSKIAYFFDFQHSHQILAKKSQIQDAFEVLTSIGIIATNEFQGTCKML